MTNQSLRRSSQIPAPHVPGSVAGLRPHRLFIAGCQRSGTTALLYLLNADPRIALGRERYKYVKERLSPEFFVPQKFLHPIPEETNFREADYYDRLRTKWERGEIVYVGDKTPHYYQVLPQIAETFPEAKILFLVRDLPGVAASYNARAANLRDRVWPFSRDYRQAVVDWNESLRRLRDFLRTPFAKRLFVVHYAAFFCGNERYLQDLYGFLGLALRRPLVIKFRQMTAGWSRRRARPLGLSDSMLTHLNARRDTSLEQWIFRKVPPPEEQSSPL